MNNKQLPLILAVVIVVAAGLIVFAVVANGNHAASAPPRVVVVAKDDIPVKTRLTDAMLQTEERPAESVDASALASISAAVGQVSTVPITHGGVVTSAELAPASSLGLAVELRPGYRAVSITMDQVKAVSSLIHPGDHVDVIAVPPRSEDSQPRVGAMILSNVTVLAMGQQFTPGAIAAPQSGGPVIPGQGQDLSLIHI